MLHSVLFNQLNQNIAECFHLESEQREANIMHRIKTILIANIIKKYVKMLARLYMKFLEPYRHCLNEGMKAEMIGR